MRLNSVTFDLRQCAARMIDAGHLAIKVAPGIKGEAVVEVLKRLMARRRLSRTIRVDNGAEFTSKRLDQWAYLNGVELDFSRPGKPMDNAFIEAFNGRFRQECLNEN